MKEEHLMLGERALKVMKTKPVYKKMLKTFLMFHPQYQDKDLRTQFSMLFSLEICP